MKTKVLDRFYLIPSMYSIVREEATDQSAEELAKHFQDVYKLFLRRLSDFEMQADSDSLREEELTNLLTELIKTKRLLQHQN